MSYYIKIQSLKYHRSLIADLGIDSQQAWECVQQKYGLSKGEIFTLSSIAIAWVPS